MHMHPLRRTLVLREGVVELRSRQRLPGGAGWSIREAPLALAETPPELTRVDRQRASAREEPVVVAHIAEKLRGGGDGGEEVALLAVEPGGVAAGGDEGEVVAPGRHESKHTHLGHTTEFKKSISAS